MGRIFSLSMLLALIVACKSTEDHLADLHNSLDRQDSSLNLAVFDSGQLIHESLSGLANAPVLTLNQMGRSVYQAGRILDGNEVPLLRAGAVNLLAHIALRYPLPPLEQPYSQEKATDVGIALVEEFHLAMEPLQAEALIGGLASADRVVAEENYARLLELTGQSLPMESGPWTTWWEANRETFLTTSQGKAREPLRRLALLRYGSLANARVVLGFLSASARIHALPALRDELELALTRLSRQVVVHGLERALRLDPDSEVRTAAARAMESVKDPRFGIALLDRLLEEGDFAARGAIVQALKSYPSGRTIQGLIAQTNDLERSVRIKSVDVLTSMTGVTLGDDSEAWAQWWSKVGKDRWP
ncbi:MAG TPA: HEAT repeat domain-containing protein [Planctomycetota bacterium]|nr:HEAT repeat domain-containing protein [Planctomycetota bacterium]